MLFAISIYDEIELYMDFSTILKNKLVFDEMQQFIK